MSRRNVISGSVARSGAGDEKGRALRATTSPTRAPIRVWVMLSSGSQARLQARVDPVCIGFKDPGLVRR